MSEASVLEPDLPVTSAEEGEDRQFDWRKIVDSPEGRAAILVFVALCAAFYSYLNKLQSIWFEPDSLYSHGPLIPVLALAVVWERWDKLKNIPVRGSWVGLVVMVPVLYVTWIASRTLMTTTLSATFILAVAAAVLFVGGWRWLWGLAGPIALLAFAVPFWTGLVDKFTQPLQSASTEMSFVLLKLFGLNALRVDATTIYLDRFQLNVAAACSGAKTTLALVAFSAFFSMLGRGRWPSVVGLFLLLIPFSLLINGVRIALIGLIGNEVSQAAGMAFHDYGAYGVLIVSFLLLKQITRMLGFKQ